MLPASTPEPACQVCASPAQQAAGFCCTKGHRLFLLLVLHDLRGIVSNLIGI